MVMGSGVVSVDLAHAGWDSVSIAVLAAGAVVWLSLLVFGELAADVAGVAATAVLGTRVALIGWPGAAWALAAGAAMLWALGVPFPAPPRPASGQDFLPAVATQSLAVAAASLAPSAGGWTRVAGTVLFLGGLALYARVVIRFRPASLARRRRSVDRRRGAGDLGARRRRAGLGGRATASVARRQRRPLGRRGGLAAGAHRRRTGSAAPRRGSGPLVDRVSARDVRGDELRGRRVGRARLDASVRPRLDLAGGRGMGARPARHRAAVGRGAADSVGRGTGAVNERTTSARYHDAPGNLIMRPVGGSLSRFRPPAGRPPVLDGGPVVPTDG
jgi:hypothetical protein